MKGKKVMREYCKCGICHKGSLLFFEIYDFDDIMVSLNNWKITTKIENGDIIKKKDFDYYKKILYRKVVCTNCGVRGIDCFWKKCPQCGHKSVEVKYMLLDKRYQKLCRCGNLTITTPEIARCQCHYNRMWAIEEGKLKDIFKTENKTPNRGRALRY